MSAAVETLRNELLWIYTEVWPLVHSLNSRDAIRERFLRLPGLIESVSQQAAVDQEQERAASAAYWAGAVARLRLELAASEDRVRRLLEQVTLQPPSVTLHCSGDCGLPGSGVQHGGPR